MSAPVDDGIDCPHCGKRIPLAETLRHQVDRQVAEQVRLQLAAGSAALVKRAREEVDVELRAANEALAERDRKLEEARAQELDLRRRERALEDGKKELELAVEKRVGAERKAAEEAARKAALEEQRLAVAEKDKTIQDLQERLADASRRASQGSQQLQGEVLELDLEVALREAFPSDEILPVPKGVRGADILQRVRGPSGRACGLILWESKRTKNWSDAWLGKLREDQGEAKADLSILVSEALPAELPTFGHRDGVWVTGRAFWRPLAQALRAGLLEVSAARDAGVAKDEKMEVLFRYLTGPEFRNRVLAVVEAFRDLQKEMDAEKRAAERRWATQQKVLERAMRGISGMHGDLKGMAGPTIPSIPALEGPAEGPPETPAS